MSADRWPCCKHCTDGHMEDHSTPCQSCRASTDARRLAMVRRYVEEGLRVLPPNKEENEDHEDEINDALRETLEDLARLLA